MGFVETINTSALLLIAGGSVSQPLGVCLSNQHLQRLLIELLGGSSINLKEGCDGSALGSSIRGHLGK